MMLESHAEANGYIDFSAISILQQKIDIEKWAKYA